VPIGAALTTAEFAVLARRSVRGEVREIAESVLAVVEPSPRRHPPDHPVLRRFAPVEEATPHWPWLTRRDLRREPGLKRRLMVPLYPASTAPDPDILGV
jgi:hypothetical protein